MSALMQAQDMVPTAQAWYDELEREGLGPWLTWTQERTLNAAPEALLGLRPVAWRARLIVLLSLQVAPRALAWLSCIAAEGPEETRALATYAYEVGARHLAVARALR